MVPPLKLVGPQMSLIGVGLFAAGLVVTPAARLRKPLAAPVSLSLCDDQTAPAPPPSPTTPSLLTRLTEGGGGGGIDLWSELAEPFAAAAGVPYEPSGPLKAASAFEKADIDLEAFQGLLTALGDTLPEEKTSAMFKAVDTDGDGRIEFVQAYKAIRDEALEMRGGGGGLFGAFFGGN